MLLRVTAFDPSADKVGKGLTAPIIELALGSYPGFSVTRMPGPGTAYGVYRPAYIPRSVVEHTVVHHDGTTEVIADPKTAEAAIDPTEGQRPSPYPAPTDTLTRRVPLGTFVHGRSGDKGGDANIGLWVKNDGHPKYAERVTWLTKFMSRRRVRELIPEAADLDDRGLRPAQPRRRQRPDPRPARRGRGRHRPLRPPGQGPRGVGPLSPRQHRRKRAVTTSNHASTTASPRSSSLSRSPRSSSRSAR